MILDQIFEKQPDSGLSAQDLAVYLSHAKIFSNIIIRAIEKKFYLKSDPCLSSLLHLLYH
jgi:hypothetical protein